MIRLALLVALFSSPAVADVPSKANDLLRSPDFADVPREVEARLPFFFTPDVTPKQILEACPDAISRNEVKDGKRMIERTLVSQRCAASVSTFSRFSSVRFDLEDERVKSVTVALGFRSPVEFGANLTESAKWFSERLGPSTMMRVDSCMSCAVVRWDEAGPILVLVQDPAVQMERLEMHYMPARPKTWVTEPRQRPETPKKEPESLPPGSN